MAHWIIDDRGFGGCWYECSNCGRSWNNIFENPGMWNECHGCGEKMDEDETQYIENNKQSINQVMTQAIKTVRELDENVCKLEQVSGKSIEELIELFAAGWILTPPYSNTKLSDLVNMIDSED